MRSVCYIDGQWEQGNKPPQQPFVMPSQDIHPSFALERSRICFPFKSDDQQPFPTANHLIEASKLNHLWPNLSLNSTMCPHFTYHRWFVVNQNTQNSVCQSHWTWYANICLVRWKRELSPDLQLRISVMLSLPQRLQTFSVLTISC